MTQTAANKPQASSHVFPEEGPMHCTTEVTFCTTQRVPCSRLPAPLGRTTRSSLQSNGSSTAIVSWLLRILLFTSVEISCSNQTKNEAETRREFTKGRGIKRNEAKRKKRKHEKTNQVKPTRQETKKKKERYVTVKHEAERT